MKYQILDWTNKICFDGKKFDSFEDAWGFIHENDPCPIGENDDHWFDDYFVEVTK